MNPMVRPLRPPSTLLDSLHRKTAFEICPDIVESGRVQPNLETERFFEFLDWAPKSETNLTSGAQITEVYRRLPGSI
jgi:hypothetical protein